MVFSFCKRLGVNGLNFQGKRLDRYSDIRCVLLQDYWTVRGFRLVGRQVCPPVLHVHIVQDYV